MYIFFYSTAAFFFITLEGLGLIMAPHMGIMNLSFPGRLYAYGMRVCARVCENARKGLENKSFHVKSILCERVLRYSYSIFSRAPNIRRVLLVFVL